MPTRAATDAAIAKVEAAKERLQGRLAFDHVVPDYYASRPKACMSGWGRRFLNITPSGRVLPLPCGGDDPGTGIPVGSRSTVGGDLARRTGVPSISGHRLDAGAVPELRPQGNRLGGCRCQALAITGAAENADPACALSPFHDRLQALALAEAAAEPPPFRYRQFSDGTVPA